MTRVAVAVEGWNAEAAIGFALAARRFTSAVTLSAGTETVNGKDEIEVMTLGPELGEEVLMSIDGKDEKEAFKALLAGLLGVIESPKSRLAAVIGPGTAGEVKASRPPRRRVAEIAALDVEEVAPVRPRRKKQGTPRRKPRRKAGRKPTTTRRKPRKPKK